MSVGDGVGRAGLNAIAAKDAARIVDIVNTGVAFTGGDALRVGVFGGFDVDATRRACCGAQEAANTFFQAVFVAVENVNSTVARLEMDGFFGIVFGDSFPKHIAERHAETLYQGYESLASFSNDRGHRDSV